MNRFKPYLYDVYAEALALTVLAESDNILFDVSSQEAEAEESQTLGTRETYIAPFGAGGVARAQDFIFLAKLRAGDTGPTPEAVTEDTTYDNGVVVSNQTGVNNGAKTWEVEGSADDPAIAMLIEHCRIPGFGTPERRGRSLAYIAFNEDRSSISGSLKVNTASPPREGAHRWVFTVAFQTVEFRRPSQNPIASVAGRPAAAFISPESGPVGTTVTITGVNMDNVVAVRFGPMTVDTFTTQTASQVSFTVPAGATEGVKTVTLVHDTDEEVYAGTFTVTA